MDHNISHKDARGIDDLLGIDWRKAWIERECTRSVPDNAQAWDKRAKDYSVSAGASSYVDSFISYLAPEQGVSILDMGSGSGTLALPLARRGHSVMAVDFSSGMLGVLREAAQAEALSSIRCVQLDFNAPWSDWEAAGITEDCVDIAIASRSTIVDDLWAAFEKLERAARTRVAVTLVTEYTPRHTKRMGAVIDGGPPYIPDYIYAVNVLLQMGRYPSVSYIDSDKTDERGTPRLIRWAFISWDVDPKH